MYWFQRSGYMTFGFINKTSLQLQILLINAIGLLNLAGNNFNWVWLTGDLQLKKIWELPILESDNSDVKDINWIKTILSQIVLARFIINSVSLVAYVANIYTILTRDRQNLLIFWMVLSFVKDIFLEIVVVIITLILWHYESITTSLLVEFIIKKAIRLAVSIWKWCTTLNWYLQLRKVAKIRECFESISRRSNTSVADAVRKVGHSLDDASLGIAMVRRGKYTSLLSLDEFFEESNRVKFKSRVYFDLRTSKSLTTLITNESYDMNGTNDYDSIGNDLSVAEKSMKMLDITAEDVMDARARIQERSYWIGRVAPAKNSNLVDEMMTCFSSKKDGKETEDTFRDGQIVIGDKEHNKEEAVDATEDVALEKKGATKYSLIEKEKKTDSSETVSWNEEKEIFIEEREEIVSLLSLKNGAVTSDELKNQVTSVTSRDVYNTSIEKKGGAQKTMKIVPSSSSGYERNMNAKACSVPVKDMETKLRSVLISCRCKWIGEADQKRHSYWVETKLSSGSINANKKEHSENSKILLPRCHCASNMNIRTQNNKETSQSINARDKNVNRDIDKRKSKVFISNVVAREDKGHGSALKHLELLKKPMQTCQECLKEQPVDWDSMSLAQTAHSSGYERRFVAPDKLAAYQNNFKSVQTEIFNDSENSLSEQRRLKHVQQTRHTQSFDLRLVNDYESFKKKNYMKFKERETTEAKTFGAYDFILLEDEKPVKTRNRYNLLSNRRLSAEEHEAIELRALKAYNKRTLLEDKKKLEAKKKCASSLEEREITRTKDSNNDIALHGNEEGAETIIGNDLPTNYKQSIEKLEALTAHSKFTSSSYNLIEVPTKAFDLLEADNVPDRSSEVGIIGHLPKTRDDANSDFDLNDHNARHTRVSLNLREVTRNIEWSPYPGGITLINKSLQGDLSENGRHREGQHRDIVDNNIASALHNAFFFKPEIIMRIFRRAEIRAEESRSNFGTWRRDDFNVEFICRMNNEMNEQDRDSLLDFDFEWITGRRSNLSHSLLFGTNGNRNADEENNHDLCIIFVGREEFPSESETAIVEDLHSLNIENVQATNVLVFDANCRQTDNATADNLPVQFIISVLRNFGNEMSEEGVRDVSIKQIEEFGNMSNATVISAFPSRTFNTNDMSNDRGHNMCDRISLSQSDYCNDKAGDEKEQILYSSNKCSVNLDVSSVNSLEHDNYYDSQDEKYLSALDINLEDEVSENNLSLIKIDNDVMSQSLNFDNNNDNDDNRQSGILNNKIEGHTSNVIFKNSTEIFSPKMSFTKSYSPQISILTSANKELEKLTQLTEERSTLENERNRLISNSDIQSGGTILQSKNVETLISITTTQNSVRTEDEDGNIYKKTNKFSTGQLPGIYPSDESDCNSLYEKNDDESEPTLHEGSLMEEFE